MAEKSKSTHSRAMTASPTTSDSQVVNSVKNSDSFRYRHKGTINEVETQWLPLDSKYIDRQVGSQEQISQWIHKNRFYFPSESASHSKRHITDLDVHPLFHNRKSSKESTEWVPRPIWHDPNFYEKNKDKKSGAVNPIIKNTSDKSMKLRENQSKKELKKGADGKGVQKVSDKRKHSASKIGEVKHKFLIKAAKKPVVARLLPIPRTSDDEIKTKTSRTPKHDGRRPKSKSTDEKAETSKQPDAPVQSPQHELVSDNDEESRAYESTAIDKNTSKNDNVVDKSVFKRMEHKENVVLKHDSTTGKSENSFKLNTIWPDNKSQLTNERWTPVKRYRIDKTTENAIDAAIKTPTQTNNYTGKPLHDSSTNIKTNRNLNVNYCLLQPTYFPATNNKKPRAQYNGVKLSTKFPKMIIGDKRTRPRSKPDLPGDSLVNSEMTGNKLQTETGSVTNNYVTGTITNNSVDSERVTDKNAVLMEDMNCSGSTKKFISKATIIRIDRRQRNENKFNKCHNSQLNHSSECRNEKGKYIGLKYYNNANKSSSKEHKEMDVAEKDSLTLKNNNEMHHIVIIPAEKKTQSNAAKCALQSNDDCETQNIQMTRAEKSSLSSRNGSESKILKVMSRDKKMQSNSTALIMCESLKDSSKQNSSHEMNGISGCGCIENKRRKVFSKKSGRKSTRLQNYWQHKKEKALKRLDSTMDEMGKFSIQVDKNCGKTKTASDSKSETTGNEQHDMSESENSSEANRDSNNQNLKKNSKTSSSNIRPHDSKRKSIIKKKKCPKPDEDNNDEKPSSKEEIGKSDESNAISINLPVGKKYNINAPNLFSVVIDDKNPLGGDSAYMNRRPKVETLYHQNSTDTAIRKELRDESQLSNDKLCRATVRAPKKYKREYRDQQIQMYNRYLKSTIKVDETDANAIPPVLDQTETLEKEKSNSNNFPFINKFGSNGFIKTNLIDLVDVFDNDGNVLTNPPMKHKKEPKNRHGLEGVCLDLYKKDKASWMLMEDGNKSEAFYSPKETDSNPFKYSNNLYMDSKPEKEKMSKDEEIQEICKPQKVSSKKKKRALHSNAATPKPKNVLKDHHVQFVDILTDTCQVFSRDSKNPTSCFLNKEICLPKHKRKNKSASKEILFCTNKKHLISNLDSNEDRGNRSKTVLVYSRLSYKPSHEDTSYKSLRYHELKVSDLSHAEISKTNRKKKFIKLLKKMFNF